MAAEESLASSFAPDLKGWPLVEVKGETDFVARDDDFRAVRGACALVARDAPADVAALSIRTLAAGEIVEARRVAWCRDRRKHTIRRFARLEAKAGSRRTPMTKIGVLVDVTAVAKRWARTSRCTVAASKPMAVAATRSPESSQRREIAALARQSRQARNSSKRWWTGPSLIPVGR